MPVAWRKAIFRCSCAANREVAGSQNVTEPLVYSQELGTIFDRGEKGAAPFILSVKITNQALL